jgi:hypothetical protein
MLPTDLLIHRQTGEAIAPKRLDIDDKMRAIATQLITCFQECLGNTQGELDRQLLELEGDSPDYRLKRGLAHILKGLSTFEIVSPLEPPDLRKRVFALSAESVPSTRASIATLDKLAMQLTEELNREVLPVEIRTGLYADLAENRILTQFETPTPEELLHRYNLAQVQAFISLSQTVSVDGVHRRRRGSRVHNYRRWPDEFV